MNETNHGIIIRSLNRFVVVFDKRKWLNWNDKLETSSIFSVRKIMGIPFGCIEGPTIWLNHLIYLNTYKWWFMPYACCLTISPMMILINAETFTLTTRTRQALNYSFFHFILFGFVCAIHISNAFFFFRFFFSLCLLVDSFIRSSTPTLIEHQSIHE